MGRLIVRWLRKLEQSDWLDLAIVLPPLAAFGWFLLVLVEPSFWAATFVAVGWLVATAGLVLLARRLLRRIRAARGFASFVIVSMTALAVPLIWLAWFEPDPWFVNEASMRVAKARLQRVARDLDALPTYGAARSRARVSGCGIDSGQVFQPVATRTWATAEKEVASEIARDLGAAGWTVSPTIDGDFSLTREFGAWTAHVFVGSAYQGFPAFVEARIDGLEPCSPRVD